MDTTISKTIIALSFILFSGCYGQKASELFARGNKAYERSDLDEAIEQYVAIKKKGPATWYNLGNCYYQKNDSARAIVCWQRSVPGSSWQQYADVQHNITAVSHSLGIDREQWQLGQLMDRAAHTIPVWIIQWFFLLSWWGLWLLVLYRKRIRLFYFVATSTVLIAIFFGGVAWLQFGHARRMRGIVVTKNMALHAGPNHGYHGLGNVAYGDTVELIEVRPGWYKITHGDAVGWVSSAAIELIEPLS